MAGFSVEVVGVFGIVEAGNCYRNSPKVSGRRLVLEAALACPSTAPHRYIATVNRP
jgi:hypothetical protein